MSSKLEERLKKTAKQPSEPARTDVDRGIADGLEDVREGRIDGPYTDADSFLEALHRDAALHANNKR